MSLPHDTQPRSELEHGLRMVKPDEITTYLDQKWKRQVRVQYPEEGRDRVVVPPGWHGAGKKGDVLVTFGDLLTKPIAETHLPAEDFVEWLARKGFAFEYWGGYVDPEGAAAALESNVETTRLEPIFRAMFTGSSAKVPILLEFYFGSQAERMQELSSLGNAASLTDEQRGRYRRIVQSLLQPFHPQGLRKVKERLGLAPEIQDLTRLDDCLASGVTFAGDIVVLSELTVPRNRLEVFEVSVATTQGVVIAIHLAENLGFPLALRAGAPSFGLAGRERGLNYMVNTQKKMLGRGYFTAGDFGAIMSDGTEPDLVPHHQLRGRGSQAHETRIFLNGGWPILRMMDDVDEELGKSKDGVISVARASRVDDGPEMWGAIFDYGWRQRATRFPSSR